jgi:hypothetical protein
MTIAMDIIQGRMPDFAAYVQAGESLDDIDEFGFTPLIESIIARNFEVTRALVQQRVSINKPDVAGRTALQWAVDNNDEQASTFLIKHGADTNAFTKQGFSALVYPLLREENKLKQLLLKNGANLAFAQDFISAKLIGHRFSLKGTVDIVTPKQEMIEVDYEGFVLEFTVSVIQNSLSRFINSYAARRWRDDFFLLKKIQRGFEIAEKILLWQRQVMPGKRFHEELASIADEPFLILPAASSGHAMGFILCDDWLAKIDRGENSQKEGSVNIYRIGKRDKIDAYFLDEFLFKRQKRSFFHQQILRILDLKKIASLPMGAQIVGNCSWANMEACVGIGHLMLSIYPEINLEPRLSGYLYRSWLAWDQDRAIEELIEASNTANRYRKASIISMLCGILFQNLDGHLSHDTHRAEKMLKTIVHPDYLYILQSYLDIYCPLSYKTAHGENLLRLLDNCGYDPEQLRQQLK